jgi:ribosomal protein S17
VRPRGQRQDGQDRRGRRRGPASSTRCYGKVIRRTSNLKAHDEANACGVGDRVLLMETRPLSATKRWRVVEIVEKAK